MTSWMPPPPPYGPPQIYPWPYGYQAPPGQRAQRSNVATFALLALAQKKNAQNQPAPMKIYVNGATGSDAATQNGSAAFPLKSVEEALARIGEPADQADYETPMEIVANGVEEDTGAALAVPTRQLRITGIGSTFRRGFQTAWTSDLMFGSALLPSFTVEGDGMGVPQAAPASTPLNGPVVIGNGALAIAVTVATNPVPGIVLVQDAYVTGDIRVDDFTGSGGHRLFFRRCLLDAPLGTGIVQTGGVASAEAQLYMDQCTCVQAAPAYAITVDKFQQALNCVLDIAVTVGSVASTASLGFLGTNCGANFSWTGPAGSMTLDATTNYFVVANVSTVAAAAKTLAFNSTP